VAVPQLGGGAFGCIDPKPKGRARHRLVRTGQLDLDKPKGAARLGLGRAQAHEQAIAGGQAPAHRPQFAE
jgi:hypothetical protein